MSPRDTASPLAELALALPRQRTLARAVAVEGAGVHSGDIARMTLHPASADHGIVFERQDLAAPHNRVAARWDAVQISPLCTLLVNPQGVAVRTVEHIMAALYALGIDNARIELSHAEVPVMDGGAELFCRLLLEAGLENLVTPRRFLRVLQPIEARAGDAFARLLPSDSNVFSITVAYPKHGVLPQSCTFDLETDDFVREIAPARTFAFGQEIEALRAKGLALGGSFTNALLIGEAGEALNPGGYHFPNELARHKLLDAVGDLALGGFTLLGRFEGHLSGHALNNQLLRTLFAMPEAWRLEEGAALAAPQSLPAFARHAVQTAF